jgi:hypothetical protein
MNVETPAAPGERWRANIQPIDETSHESVEEIVTLVDYDPRTSTWSVTRDGRTETIALLAKHLIRRLE